MAVILGNSGIVELTRSSIDETFTSDVNPSDVNPTKNSFSFDFPLGQLLTGDQLEIKATDGDTLDFITGWTYPDGKWFINVDPVGGIRLYEDFEGAVNGEITGRVDLQLPSRDIPIEVKVQNSFARCLAEVTEFELNTSRDAVDVTEIGEEFRQQFGTLISGSGTIGCFFEYQQNPCGSDGSVTPELALYMHQLVIRQQLGSEFKARLYLVRRGTGSGVDFDDEVWYEFNAWVTNVAIAFEPTQLVRSQIQFVTNGLIQLKVKTASNYLLQENDDRILLERNQGTGYLEVEQQE